MTKPDGSTDEQRPWLRFYPDGVDPDPALSFHHLGAAWRDRVERIPDSVLVHYFDATMTTREVEEAADALAVAFQERGVVHGDRVAVYLQSVPHYVVTLLALWKLGAIAVPINPMYRAAELRRLVEDCRPVGIVLHHADAAATAVTLQGTSVTWTVGVDDRDFQTRDDLRVPWVGGTSDAPDLAALLRDHAGRRPSQVALAPDDVALLCYTSGTTGPPKGALNSHADVLHSATAFGSWIDLGAEDVVLGIAPLFHISGVILNAAVALFNDSRLVLVGRYQPDVVLDAFEEHRVTFTIGSITAFNALMALERGSAEHLASVRLLYSGGAPIPPSTVEAFEARFGHYIHNVWGMTETTAGGIAVPPGQRARIHQASGTLSIGVPTGGATVRVVDAAGNELPSGEPGELEFEAPQVISGYWEKPEATERTLPGGRLRTGDVAVVDEDGWVYLVDRLKDQINTSGYKVWPREVEDSLYEHPAVYEAAVVGEPDDYRGEAVVAYVSLKPGREASAEELVAFARERLAAYKAPRRVTLLDELPKTATGKIRRQAVRGGAPGP